MGLTLGIRYDTATNRRGKVICVAEKKYRKFPQKFCREPGQLIIETVALPKRCYSRSAPTDAYWWMDAQFLPNNDAAIFCSSAAYQPRTNHAWINESRIPNGRIIRFDLHETGQITCEMFKDSRMPSYPKLLGHPSGQYIGYVGPEAVKIVTFNHEEIYNKLKDLRSCSYKFCAFSPNGKYLAILLSVSRTFELLISRTDKGTTFSDNSVDLSRMIKDFKGSNNYNEHLECKWSPDSEHVAVCTNINFMFVLNSKLELIVNICTDILPPDVFPSWSGTFDYDPRSCHQILAVGANDRCIYFIDTESNEVTCELQPLSRASVDCVLYNPSGTCIAISVRDFNIFLIDTSSCEVTFHIDIKLQCPKIKVTEASFPAVMRLSFSSKGEQLATSTCDGKVRLWQLPVSISLFNLCKWEILGNVPPSKVKHLPLPVKIIESLLPFPD